jgi:hypothetical protein
MRRAYAIRNKYRHDRGRCGVAAGRSRSARISALTLDQAAVYLGLTKDALKAKVHIGRVPTVELDKKLRLTRKISTG